MKKFYLSWTESYTAEAIIEAETEEDALQKWEDGDFEYRGKLGEFGINIEDSPEIEEWE